MPLLRRSKDAANDTLGDAAAAHFKRRVGGDPIIVYRRRHSLRGSLKCGPVRICPPSRNITFLSATLIAAIIQPLV
jgi:hypothetical protein